MNTDATDTTTKPIDLKRLRKRIKDRERRFKAATTAGKRVMIAKDVLNELKVKTIVPGGVWLGQELTGRGTTELEKAKATDIRESLLTLPSCTACAVGAMFIAAVKRANEATLDLFAEAEAGSAGVWDGIEYVDIWPDFSQLSGYLSKWFTKNQIKLIELAYERGEGGTDPVTNADYKAVAFGEKFGERGERQAECMTAIMKNIVANNGTFKP